MVRVVTILAKVFPAQCVCGALGEVPCEGCADEVQRCAPFVLPGLHQVSAAFLYEGRAGELVRALKYRQHRTLVAWAVDAMMQVAGEHPPALVTWVPASRAGRRSRGLDQGAVLARAMGRRLGVPAVALLRPTGSARQTGSGRTERVASASYLPAPRLKQAAAYFPSVVIIDDVITTGASMTAAAAVMREGGFSNVSGCAVARADRTTFGATASRPERR